MSQDTFLLNLFFSYFFNLGEYLQVFFALGLTGLIFLGFVKYFIRN
jgi:hypothetical protein